MKPGETPFKIVVDWIQGRRGDTSVSVTLYITHDAVHLRDYESRRLDDNLREARAFVKRYITDRGFDYEVITDHKRRKATYTFVTPVTESGVVTP